MFERCVKSGKEKKITLVVVRYSVRRGCLKQKESREHDTLILLRFDERPGDCGKGDF